MFDLRGSPLDRQLPAVDRCPVCACQAKVGHLSEQKLTPTKALYHQPDQSTTSFQSPDIN